MDGTPLQLTDRGLYCEAGDFHVDPWRPVERAVITHAHADHATWGCRHYLTSAEGEHVLRARVGREASIQTLPFGADLALNRARISLHPAGHILGSCQVRIEVDGYVLVVSGDYKTTPDRTCTPFEPVRCHAFLTESTFGLPIYRWRAQEETYAEIDAWWRANAEAGKASLLYAYALGKSQRLLAGVDPTIGPIYTHGAVEPLNRAYAETGIDLPHTEHAGAKPTQGESWAGALILAPPSAQGTPWTRKFGAQSSGYASGWMAIRGPRRRRAVDRGFILSDHADWAGLLEAIAATGAGRVLVTHGYSAVLSKYLQEAGFEAEPLATRYAGELDAAPEFDTEAPAAPEPTAGLPLGEGEP
jgi:putative mRNA 3-end processing factor